MAEQDKKEARTRPFADFLQDHNRGQGHRQAGEALQRLVHAVTDTGKKGSVTLRVDVETMKNAPAGTLLTTVTVTEKLPVDPPKAAVFYADDENNLVRQDPRQLAFEGLREADRPEVRDTPARPVVAAGGDA